MILGLGLDVVSIDRISRSLSDGAERFEERVFTPAERQVCASRHDRLQALAARFAAKEACLKALGTGWTGGLSFQQVEVLGSEGGQPELRLSGRAAERAQTLGVRRVHVTLSHEHNVAAAVVILEG